MRFSRLAARIGASVVIAWATSLWAQAPTPRPMGIVDLLNLPRIAEPRLSPDGRSVLYTRAESDWKTGRRVTHIWRASVGGGAGSSASVSPTQLTNGQEGETSPRWSPDGKTVAFLAKRGDNEFNQLYLLSADGGEAQQLTRHASAVSEPSWFPDGTALYFSAADAKTADEKAAEKVRDDVYSYDENYKQTHLWKVVVGTKAETRITSGDFSVTAYELSHDGKKIVYHRAPTPLLGDRDRGEVWIADNDGSGAIQLTKNTVEESEASVSPDDSRVLFISGSNARFEPYYNARLFVVPSGGGQARVLAGEERPGDRSATGGGLGIERAMWSSDGQSIYLTANLGVHDELFVMPAAGGAPRKLTDGRHNISGWSQMNGHMALVIADSTSGGDIWTLGPNDKQPTQVTHVFDDLSRTFKLGKQEAIQWKGADGVTVEGIVTYPVDYHAGERYPLAVMTHGGPQAADKFSLGSWGYEIQVLAGKGYVVLQPNYRGSTGYGDAFLRDMVGHYFQNAHLDVLAGVDEVIRRGIADPNRMVKMGWSGGGHMTNKIITFTDRFKAAASGAGAADWVSMYAQSDIRSYRTPWFGGTPWQADAPIDAFWNNSPLKDVSRVKTPTIFFVGERDPRVPMPQSVEMYRALRTNGVETHLYVAPREPHSWGELRHDLFKLNTEIAWFEKHATGRPFTWEKAPGDQDPAKGNPRSSTNQQP